MTDLMIICTTSSSSVRWLGWCWGSFSQGFFHMRFVVQWIASERARKERDPGAVWFFSIGGRRAALIYALLPPRSRLQSRGRR